MSDQIRITECPRDAMQGIAEWIPTDKKTAYINQLLKVGFDTIDFGSFVSPKAVPQMKDTHEVLKGIDKGDSHTDLLAIVVNRRGAEEAVEYSLIDYLGYPFSISETFQQRNSRKSMAESVELLKGISDLCHTKNKKLLVYLSMAFGNPYDDPWEVSIVESWTENMAAMGVKYIALADTIGSSDQKSIQQLFSTLIPKFPEVEIGAHFHANPNKREEKIRTAWESGCRKFDTALQGFGGCPFAEDELVGNIATESLLFFCDNAHIETRLDKEALATAMSLSREIFPVS